MPSVNEEELTEPTTTWYVSMSTSVALPASVSREARSIPASAKAASVGAKTVNGPAPCRVATSSAWARAATSELCIVVAWAVMAMLTAGTHA